MAKASWRTVLATSSRTLAPQASRPTMNCDRSPAIVVFVVGQGDAAHGDEVAPQRAQERGGIVVPGLGQPARLAVHVGGGDLDRLLLDWLPCHGHGVLLSSRGWGSAAQDEVVVEVRVAAHRRDVPDGAAVVGEAVALVGRR